MNRRLIKRKIIDLELDATKAATTASKIQKSALLKSQKVVETKALAIVGLKAGNPSALELIKVRIELANLIKAEFSDISAQQLQHNVSLLSNIYNSARVEISSTLGSQFDVTNNYQLKALLARSDKGLTLSQRIWGNNDAIATRLNTDIGKLLYMNASPEDLKRAIANDYKISYNAADRLIRTETSKFYNTAAMDSYKDAGLTEVEFLAEADACEEFCQPNDGKIFSIEDTSNVPPLHPNCRCAILPVIPK